jgi:hypothetical protein
MMGALAVVLATAGSSIASTGKATTTVCKGTPKKPGVLKGKVAGNVVVRGACEVKDGSATVDGSLTVTPNSVLAAIFGHNDKTHKGHSNLTVTGNVVVKRGATAFLGCEAAHSPCLDDSQTAPTLSNKVTIGGNLKSTGALGVIVHVTKIGGNVTQTGGGGSESCMSMPGIFAVIKSPVFSDYEDDTIGGSISISGLTSCWLGALRDRVAKNFTLNNNAMGDPDAMEIGNNVIVGNLACAGNTNVVPVSSAVWDSHEANPNNGSFFPRIAEPNSVKGTRSGQCNMSTPLTQGGPSGAPGSF